MRAHIKRRIARNREIARRDQANRCRFCKRAFVPGQPTFLVVETGLRYCGRECYLDACGVHEFRAGR